MKCSPGLRVVHKTCDRIEVKISYFLFTFPYVVVGGKYEESNFYDQKGHILYAQSPLNGNGYNLLLA